MSTTRTLCEQAIFTSVRTPMGEGYRIIAASKGLRPDEKQTITRHSPSHNGLCPAGECEPESRALAFYALPSGRVCVALSCFAGAEHTGRGGQRVYTLNVVVEPKDFANWDYNPFAIARALIDAGFDQPELKPPRILPEIDLCPAEDASGAENVRASRAQPALGTSAATACHMLNQLLEHRRVIWDTQHAWFPNAEALLLGIPARERMCVAFSAGVQFSATRAHALTVLTDADQKTKRRAAGQPYVFVSHDDDATDIPTDEWTRFVRRYWEAGDFIGLSSRTSRPLGGAGSDTRMRVGRLYNAIDGAGGASMPQLFEGAASMLECCGPDEEADIVAELHNTLQTTLCDRFANGSWNDLKPFQTSLETYWSGAATSMEFILPVLAVTLSRCAKDDPRAAVEWLLALNATTPPDSMAGEWTTLQDRTLGQLADWCDARDAEDLQDIPRLHARASRSFGNRPALDRILARYERVSTPAPTAS